MMIKQVTTGHENAKGFLVYSTSDGSFGKVIRDDGKWIKVLMQDSGRTANYLRCQLDTITTQQVAAGHSNILCMAVDYLAAWGQVTVDQGWYTNEQAGEMCENSLKEVQDWANQIRRYHLP